MTTYAYYRTDTGLFTGQAISCAPDDLLANVPAGCSCTVGLYDRLSQQVDRNTGLVIDYQPPQPSPQHVWDAASKRWLVVASDADIAVQVRSARDGLLAEGDWRAVRAWERGVPMEAAWLHYRQALRDVSAQTGFPRAVVWPAPPNA